MSKWKRGDWQIEAVIELVEDKLIPLIKESIKKGQGLLCGINRTDMANIIEKHSPKPQESK